MRKNINRTTVIIVLAVFLTISVGYALFSDTITIEGTAMAQGKFDMEVSCQPGMLSGLNSEDYFGQKEEGYKNDSCLVSEDKNTATFNVELTYPGAGRTFTVKITNKGTIDAMIDAKNLGSYTTIEVCEDGYKDGSYSYDNNGTIEDNECRTNVGNFIPYNMKLIAVEENDGNFIYINEENEMILNEKYIFVKDSKAYINIPHNSSMYLSFYIRLHPGVSNNYLARYKFGYTFDFQQSIK